MSEREASPVIEALRKFESEIDCLIDFIGDKKFLSTNDKTDCQGKLKVLKEKLKLATKTGTADGSRRKLTHYEKAYFQPAVRSASVNCNVAVNSHPINSNWVSCLYGMKTDITYMLFQLTEQYPGA